MDEAHIMEKYLVIAISGEAGRVVVACVSNVNNGLIIVDKLNTQAEERKYYLYQLIEGSDDGKVQDGHDSGR